MATETADFIGQLDQSRPQGSESLGEADDHLRLTKKCLTATMQGGISDAYDTPLVAGPRYLNSLVGKYPDPEDFVTLSTTQTITGAKTFTQDINIGVKSLNGQSGDHLISSDAISNYAGYWNKQTTLISSGRDNLLHGYGTGAIDNSAVILTTDNFASLMADTICAVNQCLYTGDNVNPETRLPGTTFIRICQGRFIAGVGGDADENGKTRTYAAGDVDGIYEKKLSIDEMPEHDHSSNRAEAGLNTAGSTIYHTFSGGDSTSKKLTLTGGSMAFNTTPPAVALYVWMRTV